MKINSNFSSIVILIVLVLVLDGCTSNAELKLIATPVSEPSQLPDTLAHQKIRFIATGGLTHIPSLDLQEIT